jgi:tape measure domain-containing protein
MINEEIARLTGSLVFKADYRTLVTFEKRLASVEGKLRAFSELANKKFNIKVTLDAKTLRAQLDKAMNAKIVFRNFSVDMVALDLLQKKICDKLDRTPIKLNNIKVNISAVMAERAFLRQQLGSVSIQARVGLNYKEALASMRAWKASTEQKFKLHLNADISRSKLLANATKTLKAVSAKLGTITIHTPKIKLSIDKAHLRAEIAAVLAQIKREVKIKIDLNSRVSGSPRVRRSPAGEGGGRMGGLGRGMGLPYGALGGLGAMAGLSHLNTVNQQQQGQRMAMLSVTGSAEAGAATKKRLDAMGDELGFNVLKMAPSFIKMIAAGKGSGFTQDQSEQVFKSMTEYGRVMGLNSEEMKGSLRAVEQMMNKGQIMSEELKGQLGERFPAAVSLMAKAYGKEVPQLLKDMKDGKVDSKVLLKFAKVISEEARKGGALGLAKMSTAANQGRAENSMNKSIQSFSEGGFDAASSAFFAAIASSFRDNQPLFRAMGDAFNMITKPVLALIEVFGKLGNMMPDIAKQFGLTSSQLMLLAGAALIAATPFGLLALAIGAIGLAINDLIGFTEGKDSLFGRFLKSSPEAQKAFDELSRSAKEFRENIDGIFSVVNKLGGAFKGLQVGEFLTNTMREFDGLLRSFNALVDRIVSAETFAKRAMGNSGSVLEGTYRGIQGLIQGPEENKAWMDRDAEAKRAQAQSELKTNPSQLDRSINRKSLDPENVTGENSPARQRMWEQAVLNPVTIDRIQIDIHGDGVLTAANIADGLKGPIEEIAKKAFGDALRETAVNQKEIM